MQALSASIRAVPKQSRGAVQYRKEADITLTQNEKAIAMEAFLICVSYVSGDGARLWEVFHALDHTDSSGQDGAVACSCMRQGCCDLKCMSWCIIYGKLRNE